MAEADGKRRIADQSVKAAQVAGAAIRVTVTAEDALIAALKVRSERPDAVIKYVRRRNNRGALHHPHGSIAVSAG